MSCASLKGKLSRQYWLNMELWVNTHAAKLLVTCAVLAAALWLLYSSLKESCKIHIDKRFVAWLLDCAAIGCMVPCWSACTLTAQPTLATFVLLSVKVLLFRGADAEPAAF